MLSENGKKVRTKSKKLKIKKIGKTDYGKFSKENVNYD